MTASLPSDLAYVLAAHIKRLREIDGLQHARFMVVPENNLPYIAESIFATFRSFHDMGHVELFMEPARGSASGGGGQPGTGVIDVARAGLTTRHKGEITERMRRMLAQRRVFVHESFVTYALPDATYEQRFRERYDFDDRRLLADYPDCTTVEQCFRQQRRDHERRTLVDQFLAYKMFETHTKDKLTGETRVKRYFTGKTSGTKRDDVLMAFAIGLTALALLELRVIQPTDGGGGGGGGWRH